MLKILIILAVATTASATTPSSYVTEADRNRLKDLFQSSATGKDLETAFYSFKGLQVLQSEFSDGKGGCSFIQSKMDSNSLESIFYAASASKTLKGCQLDAAALKPKLEATIAEKSTSKDLYFAIGALTQLGFKVSPEAAHAALLASVVDDGSAMNHAYTFYAVAAVGGDVSKFADNIEDAIAQADEVDGTYLQFESGVTSTAFIVEGIYRLAATYKQAPTAMTENKLVKFTKYLLSRSRIHNIRGAYHVTSALHTLATNSFHVPIAISMTSPVAVSSDQPTVQVRVTDVMGNSLGGGVAVTADSTIHLADQAVIINKKALSPVAGDSSLFEMNLMESNPRHGFYKIYLSVTPPKSNNKLVGLTGSEVTVKIVVPVAVSNMIFGVADRDQAAVAKPTKLQHPGKAANDMEADHHQKIMMKFELKDEQRGERMSAHQTFVRFENKKTGEEVIFKAEQEADDTYKFELDIGKNSEKFAHRSGLYRVELIVGDAVIQNPFVWHLADAKLSFNRDALPAAGNMQQYSKKREIKHLFREPEKRPPAVVSAVFSVLVLLPAVILIVLWLRIGINISNFEFSLASVGFHVCFAAIFGLYYCYWTQLNMFTTVRWLAILALPTFICGNRMLAGIAAKRKKN